jgi:hypothetical protein
MPTNKLLSPSTSPMKVAPLHVCLPEAVTTQDFVKFWGKNFVFILLVLIENSQGFKTFEFI